MASEAIRARRLHPDPRLRDGPDRAPPRASPWRARRAPPTTASPAPPPSASHPGHPGDRGGHRPLRQLPLSRDGRGVILDSGVLSRRRRIIPLSGSRTSTCGRRRSSGSAASRRSSSRPPAAGRRRASSPSSAAPKPTRSAPDSSHPGAVPPSTTPRVETLARLSTRDLVVAGATATRSASSRRSPQRVPGHPGIPDATAPGYDRFGDAGRPAARLALAGFIIAGAVALLLAGWLLSIGGAVIGYHGFTLERVGDELRKRYGLFARREGSVPLRRVQAIRIEESLMRRPWAWRRSARNGRRRRGGPEEAPGGVRAPRAPPSGATRRTRARRLRSRHRRSSRSTRGPGAGSSHGWLSPSPRWRPRSPSCTTRWLASLVLLACGCAGPERLRQPPLRDPRRLRRGPCCPAGTDDVDHPRRKIQTVRRLLTLPAPARLATLIVDTASGPRGPRIRDSLEVARELADRLSAPMPEPAPVR